MKFTFRSVVVETTAAAVRQLKEHLSQLRTLIPIDSAEAVLEQMSQPHGPYRLQVHLAVPGPDLRAESTGYTVAEAVTKMKQDLLSRIKNRRARQRGERGTNVRRSPARLQ